MHICLRSWSYCIKKSFVFCVHHLPTKLVCSTTKNEWCDIIKFSMHDNYELKNKAAFFSWSTMRKQTSTMKWFTALSLSKPRRIADTV